MQSSGCNNITYANAKNVTGTSATVEWFPGNIDDEQYRYAISDEPIERFTASNTTLTSELSADFTGLEPDKDYYFYVAPACAQFDYTKFTRYQFATTPTCFQPDSAIMYEEDNDRYVFVVYPNPNSATGNYELRFTSANGTTTRYSDESDTIVVDDLDLMTNYSWSVRTICDIDNDETSRWTEGGSFITCGVRSVPFTEGFENQTSFECWTQYSTNPSYYFYRYAPGNGYLHSGTYSMYGYHYTINDTIMIASPKVNVPEADRYEVSFYLTQYYTSSPITEATGHINVYVNDKPSLDGATLLGRAYNYYYQATTGQTRPGLYTFLLPEAGIQHIIFAGIEGTYQSFYIDDVKIDTVPMRPVYLSVNDDELGTVSGQGNYRRGATATITATANDPHYHFVRWYDAANNVAINTPTAQIVVTDTMRFVAQFQRETFTVQGTAMPANGGRVNGAGVLGYGQLAELHAVASPRYTFTGWSDGDQSNPRFYLVTKDTTFTANFVADQLLVEATSNTNDENAVTGAGLFDEGETVTLTANDVYGFTFLRWSNGETTPTITFEVTEDVNISAIYDTNSFTVSVVSSDENLGTVTGSGTYKYLSEVNVTATPATGVYFTGWSDGSVEADYTFVLTADVTLTANFSSDQVFSIVATCDDEQGFTQGSMIAATGTNVALSATANYGYIFSQWDDGDTSRNRVVTIGTENATYTALFVPDTFRITLTVNDTAMGNVMGEGRYAYKSEATIMAGAKTGYNFMYWDDNNFESMRTVTVLGDATYTAVFEPSTFNVTATADHGTVSGTGYYSYNTVATLTAVADQGYRFVGWANGSLEATIDTLVTSNIELEALFEADMFTLTVAVNDAELGSTNILGDTTVIYGSPVTLVATATYGYKLESWSTGQHDTSITVVVTENSTITANFAKRQFTIAATWTPVRLGNVTGAGQYDYLETATLTAVPADNATFVSWNDGDTNAVRQVLVDADYEFVATFASNYFRVTALSADETMGTVTASRDSASGTQVVTLTATPNPGYEFTHWSNGVTTAVYNLSGLVSDTTITAYFALRNYTVALTTADEATVTLTGAGTEYHYGDNVTVVATPAHGYRFVNWTDNNDVNSAVVSTDSAYTFIVTDNVSLNATLTRRQFNITVLTDNANMGTVSASTTVQTYLNTVTVTATPAANHSFVRWSNGSTENPLTITVESDTTLTAYFQQTSATVSVSVNDAAMGSATVDDAVVAMNGTTTLRATANQHYHFVSWSDGSTENPHTVTISSDTSFTATFAANVYHITLTATPENVPADLLEGAGDYTYTPGLTAEIKAHSTANFRFVGWSDGSSDSVRTIIITEDKEYVAQYEYVGIEDVEAAQIDIYSAEGNIYVRGAEQRMVYVYDAVGRLVMSQKAGVEVVTIPMQTSGIYVVKVDGIAARRVAVVR